MHESPIRRTLSASRRIDESPRLLEWAAFKTSPGVPSAILSYYDSLGGDPSSAREHGVSDEDIQQAGTHHLIAYTIQDDQPSRELRLGFDTASRLLEVVVLLLDDGREMAIHAMKARPRYFELLP